MAQKVESALSKTEPLSLRRELNPHGHKHAVDRVPKIVKVRDGVYMGILYDLGNVIVIETETGVIIIDTLGTIGSAQKFLDDFKSKIYLNKLLNIEIIILTHNHADHVGGLSSFVNYKENISKPKIYAHYKCLEAWKLQYIDLTKHQSKRNARQFGVLSKWFIPKQICKEKNLFIPGGIFTQFGTRSSIPFNDIIFIEQKEYILNIGGKIGDIKIYHSPGETNDMILCWIPNLSVLCCGDNFYHAFPNLYAIRGTVTRNVAQWIQSLDLMRYLPVKYLCGGHSKPMIGSNKIYSSLTVYRDSIAFVHDQTVRLMNLGYELEEIVGKIQAMIPKKLKTGKRYEFYGTIEWGIRTVYNQYVGWYQGDASQLYPASNQQRGNALELLLFDFKGKDVNDLCQYIENNVLRNVWNTKEKDDKNYDIVIFPEERWCLEVITSLLKTEKYRNNKLLKDLRWKIIKKTAGRSISSNGRNYLISMWLEEEFNLDPLGRNYGKNKNEKRNDSDNAVDSMHGVSQNNFYENIPIDWYMNSLQNKINPKQCASSLSLQSLQDNHIEYEALIKFIDSNLFYHLQIRNGGILEARNISNMTIIDKEKIEKRSNVVFEMNEIVWKINKYNYYNNFVVKGNQNDIKQFWNYFHYDNKIKSKSKSKL